MKKIINNNNKCKKEAKKIKFILDKNNIKCFISENHGKNDKKMKKESSDDNKYKIVYKYEKEIENIPSVTSFKPKRSLSNIDDRLVRGGNHSFNNQLLLLQYGKD
eukprot:GHVR01137296.1.p1 GENE.GHVR01137296.1~~GHVR01137296.1.p1  ORF type:complete len:105 (+),score=24.55 GHVR01137296.1:472-786(+)